MTTKNSCPGELMPAPQGLVKKAISLHQRKKRAQHGLFLIEGERELQAAAAVNWPLAALFYCPGGVAAAANKHAAATPPMGAPAYRIAPRVFKRLAYRSDAGGWVAMAHRQQQNIHTLKYQNKQPFLLVLDGLENPGNLGAIFRTAAVAGVDAILICGDVDPYNPNVVRNSLGGLFVVPWAQASAQAIRAFLEAQKLPTFALHPAGEQLYTTALLTNGAACVLGSEATGLSSFWQQQSNARLRLPMQTHTYAPNSLNVASTAAVIAYEVLRQRGSKGLKHMNYQGS